MLLKIAALTVCLSKMRFIILGKSIAHEGNLDSRLNFNNSSGAAEFNRYNLKVK